MQTDEAENMLTTTTNLQNVSLMVGRDSINTKLTTSDMQQNSGEEAKEEVKESHEQIAKSQEEENKSEDGSPNDKKSASATEESNDD